MKPTDEQMEALINFAAANGRYWKSKLRQCWETGAYTCYPLPGRSDLLQQVRNSFGPSWLVRFSLKIAIEKFNHEHPELVDPLNHAEN